MIPTPFGFFTFDLPAGYGRAEATSDSLVMIRFSAGTETVSGETRDGAESFLILHQGRCTLEDGREITGARQVAILPSASRFTLFPGSEAWTVAPRMTPGPAPWIRRQPGAVVHDMDQLAPPADNPRLKMLQTDRLSLNWVRYAGPRDRTRLSPHLHEDFAQGGLALEGSFTHHLRTPWGRDADAWRSDVHQAAGPASLIEIPAQVEHTSEGTGPGWHLLVDLFTPPRADYIAKGWMLNHGDYRPG